MNDMIKEDKAILYLETSLKKKREKLIKKINIINEKIELIKNKEKLNLLDGICKKRLFKKIEKIENELENINISIEDLDKYGIHKMKVNSSLRKSAKKRKQILTGDLMKTVISICFPIAIFSLFNSFYGLIDSVVCASINSDSISKVAALSQIKALISSFGAGVAAGGAIIVARHYGAGNVKEAKKNSAVLFLLGIVVSLIVIAILVPFAKTLITIAQVPNVDTNTVNYFRLQLVELAFVTLNSVFIGLEKAKGNSKMIFYLNILVLIVKLSFTMLFVYGMGVTNIMWVEFATMLGQITLFAIAMFKLFSPRNIIRISFKDFSLKWRYVGPILQISIPIFLGKFVMSFGKVFVNAMCGSYYNAATDGLIVGALSVSNNLSGLVTSPTNAFEEGESTIVSQNLGSRNMTRALKTFTKTFILVSIVSLVGFILVRFIFLDNLVEMFRSKPKLDSMTEAEIIAEQIKSAKNVEYIKGIFKYDSISIITLGFNAAVLGLLYGFGKTGLSTILNLSRIGTRILTLWILHDFVKMDYQAAGISMGISNTVIFIISLIFLLVFFKDLKKNGYKDMHIGDPEPEISEIII